jgi:hypothetical protein
MLPVEYSTYTSLLEEESTKGYDKWVAEYPGKQMGYSES